MEKNSEKLSEAFYSAEAMLGKNYFVHASFEKYAGLKAKVEFKDGKIIAKASDGFENAERDVLVGLALVLLGGMFRKRIDNAYTKAYKEFSTRESSSEYHDTLRKLRGHKRNLDPKGKYYNLTPIRDTLFMLYPHVLGQTPQPAIGWSEKKSKRILGFHDGAFNAITINRILDSERVPLFVVQYVVFHELLHCKHKVLFQRGESMRRTVHPKAFKDDEKMFSLAEKAEEWVQRNL
ncbi:MAG: hypothetical protein QXR53_03780 [Candidatus Norongarragalinales archaeon]